MLYFSKIATVSWSMLKYSYYIDGLIITLLKLKLLFSVFHFLFFIRVILSFMVDPCWIFNFQSYSILSWLYVLVHFNIRVCCKLAIDLNGCSISKFLKCLKCLVESWMVTQRDIFIFWLKSGTKLYVLIILGS